MERLPITFSCSVSSQLTDNTVPPTIHLIWLGSPLPARYLTGPTSLATLNPGHSVWVWLDHFTPAPALTQPNIRLKDVGGEVWRSQDLLDNCTNHAQRSDILRLEIVQRYGGLYVDMDAVARRPLGPVFSSPFLSYRPANWSETDAALGRLGGLVVEMGGSSAGLDTNIFAFPARHPFLAFTLCALRQNMNRTKETLNRYSEHWGSDDTVPALFAGRGRGCTARRCSSSRTARRWWG